MVVAECEHLVALHGSGEGHACLLVLAVDEGEGLSCHVGVAGVDGHIESTGVAHIVVFVALKHNSAILLGSNAEHLHILSGEYLLAVKLIHRAVVGELYRTHVAAVSHKHVGCHAHGSCECAEYGVPCAFSHDACNHGVETLAHEVVFFLKSLDGRLVGCNLTGDIGAPLNPVGEEFVEIREVSFHVEGTCHFVVDFNEFGEVILQRILECLKVGLGEICLGGIIFSQESTGVEVTVILKEFIKSLLVKVYPMCGSECVGDILGCLSPFGICD